MKWVKSKVMLFISWLISNHLLEVTAETMADMKYNDWWVRYHRGGPARHYNIEAARLPIFSSLAMDAAEEAASTKIVAEEEKESG